MELVGPVSEMIKPLCATINRQIQYARKLKKQFLKLKKLEQDLSNQRDDIEQKLENSNGGKVPTKVCESWLHDVKEIENETSKIEDEFKKDKKCFSALCPNILWRMSLGKRVTKAIDRVGELLDKSKSEEAFLLNRPPPVVEPAQLPRVMEKASIDRTLQEILKCIRNKRFHTVGILGMGGAGKTTVMKALNNLPVISKAFDIVIWVTVSSQGSAEIIQNKVAERLSLSLRNEESIESRASKISQTLSSKRFLLLLDDVWKMIDLENVGIPYQGNGSKVVLTTRSLTVCNSMETDSNVKVDVLSEEEAWDLFSSKVGDVVFSEGITGYARDVVKECDGLPLAIIVLGAALRNTDDVHVWPNALRELQSPTSFTIEGMEDRVFKPLKFSYDHLIDDNMKQCFLYCALYPEDHEINDAELIEYWRAEGQ